MSSFTKPLTVTKIGKRLWKVERTFRYYIGKEESNVYVDVQKGFLTDFASIPQAFWSILPPDGEYTQAAVLHDYLYHSRLFTRKRADLIFLEAMEVLEVPAWKRQVIYHAVRAFGWWAWHRKKG